MTIEAMNEEKTREIMRAFLKNAQELSEGSGVKPKTVKAVAETPGVGKIRVRKSGAVVMNGEVVARVAKE